MRTSTAYREAISDLANDCESCSAPGFELENQAAEIGSRFGVDDADVRSDVSAAQDRLVSSRSA